MLMLICMIFLLLSNIFGLFFFLLAKFIIIIFLLKSQEKLQLKDQMFHLPWIVIHVNLGMIHYFVLFCIYEPLLVFSFLSILLQLPGMVLFGILVVLRIH